MGLAVPNMILAYREEAKEYKLCSFGGWIQHPLANDNVRGSLCSPAVWLDLELSCYVHQD